MLFYVYLCVFLSNVIATGLCFREHLLLITGLIRNGSQKLMGSSRHTTYVPSARAGALGPC